MKILLKLAIFLALGVAIGWFAFYKTPDEKAFKQTFAAAQQNDAAAQVRLGEFYLQGRGTEPNRAQAIEWFRQAFQNGSAEASWKLAQLYINDENFDEAVAYVQFAAQDKNPAAQNELGRFYQEGLGGLTTHRGQAFYWHSSAAKLGDKNAAQWLAEIKKQDPSFYEQEETFLQYLQNAQASKASPDELVQVARAYQSGVEILPDMQEAEKWFLQAWEQGKDPQTGYELAQFYLNKENPLAQEDKGISLLAELAALPYAPAQYDLGERAYQEEPPNYKDAFAWFSNAAANGSVRGQYMTGFMLMQGQGMTRSTPLATRFFEQAAEQEYAPAQYVLGQIYYKGLGVPADKKVGEEWLKKASANGSIPAQVFLETISR